MKITVKELNSIKSSLAKLVVATGIPARACYRATKFSKKIAVEIETLETLRLELIKKHGGVADPAGNIRVPDENNDAFNADFNKVLAEEIDVPDVQIAVGDLTNANLTMLDFANLDFVIVETDPSERAK